MASGKRTNRRTRYQLKLRAFLWSLAFLALLKFGKTFQEQKIDHGYIAERLPAACPILVSVIITSCTEKLTDLYRSLNSFVNQGYMDISEVIASVELMVKILLENISRTQDSKLERFSWATTTKIGL